MKKFAILFLLFLGFGIGHSISIDTALYNLALNLYNRGEYTESITQFKNLMVKHPTTSYYNSALYYTSKAYFESADYEMSAYYYGIYYRKANTETQERQAIYGLARSHYESEEWEAALDYFETFHEDYPDSPVMDEALYYAANCYYQMDQDDSALEAFQEVVIDYPGCEYYDDALEKSFLLENANDALVASTAQVDIGRGSIDETAPASSGNEIDLRVRNNQVNESDTLFDQAMEDYHNNDWESAVDNFTAFFELDDGSSNSAEALYYLGDSYYYLFEDELAQSTFEKILREYPDSIYARKAVEKLNILAEEMGTVQSAESESMMSDESEAETEIEAETEAETSDNDETVWAPFDSILPQTEEAQAETAPATTTTTTTTTTIAQAVPQTQTDTVADTASQIQPSQITVTNFYTMTNFVLLTNVKTIEQLTLSTQQVSLSNYSMITQMVQVVDSNAMLLENQESLNEQNQEEIERLHSLIELRARLLNMKEMALEEKEELLWSTNVLTDSEVE